ncbi:hypothetical protein [Bremerella volcania]|uniref:hypothetical protein n=1 Tax=Bremerella volcania TaxID=2527984 RepID=UPI00119FA503|nr:hypothetical protein [Bremerella volcania]
MAGYSHLESFPWAQPMTVEPVRRLGCPDEEKDRRISGADIHLVVDDRVGSGNPNMARSIAHVATFCSW